MHLGADLNRVRQQVIRQLHGQHEGRRRPSRPGRAGRRERGLLPEILARVESIGAQVSALSAEVRRLRDLPGQPGTGPQDGGPRDSGPRDSAA